MLGVKCLVLAALVAAQHDQGLLSETERTVSDSSPFTSDFIQYATSALDEWKVPGCSIAVIEGHQVFARGFGFASLPDTPAAPDTLWSTGSTTKAFTAAALSLLIESGNYSALSQGWSTPISSIIRDDFVLSDAWATDHITLEDAVSHRTGIPRHDWSFRAKIDGRPATTRDTTRNLRYLRFGAEPRVKWQYSNYMFGVLSHIVETLTRKPLEDVMRARLWAPLKMNSTSFGAKQGRRTPYLLSTGYYWHREKKQYIAVGHDDLSTLSGAGAIMSSVLDYAKWLQCLIYQKPPLPQQVHRDIRQSLMIAPPESDLGTAPVLYGLAWQRIWVHGNVAYKHGGWTRSGGAFVMWLPELKYGVVVFANTGQSSVDLNYILGMRLLEDRLHVAPKDRYKIAEGCHERDRENQDVIAHFKDVLYPNRPKAPLPPTASQEQLVGRYSDPGYGLFIVEEQNASNSTSTKILVARRPGIMEYLDLRFEHISGDFWALSAFDKDGGMFLDASAADFSFAVDGRVESVRVTHSLTGGDAEGFPITFHKI